jgi:hypothetical protein
MAVQASVKIMDNYANEPQYLATHDSFDGKPSPILDP